MVDDRQSPAYQAELQRVLADCGRALDAMPLDAAEDFVADLPNFLRNNNFQWLYSQLKLRGQFITDDKEPQVLAQIPKITEEQNPSEEVKDEVSAQQEAQVFAETTLQL